MIYVPYIFSCLVVAAGWYYLWHARRAGQLESLEGTRNNRLRIRLRRMGGFCMVGLGVVFYLSILAIRREASPILLLLCLVVMVALMLMVLFLVWVDLRLTRQMRNEYFNRNSTP